MGFLYAIFWWFECSARVWWLRRENNDGVAFFFDKLRVRMKVSSGWQNCQGGVASNRE